MTVVSDALLSLLPSDSKITPSGWRGFNAVCCHHQGHSVDTRKRGGIIEEGDAVSYHCFNCGFKTGWQPGRLLSYKMRKLFEWLGANDDTITKIALDVLRINEGIEAQERIIGLPTFDTVSLPADAVLITDDSENDNKFLSEVKQYMKNRKLSLDQGYDYYWSSGLANRDRFIIPFIYQGRTVGWVSRTVRENTNYKYLLEKPPGFLFNLDNQTHDKVFCIVVEGPIDAIQIDGVALLTNEISEQQSMLLKRLHKDIIVVPDRDAAGKHLIERSIELGYAVSMPDWKLGIKDVGDAVREYGQLYTLYSIVNSAEFSPLKIRLKEKKWFRQL